MQRILEMEDWQWTLAYFGLILTAALLLYVAYGGQAVRSFYEATPEPVVDAIKRVPVEMPEESVPDSPPDALESSPEGLGAEEGTSDAQ